MIELMETQPSATQNPSLPQEQPQTVTPADLDEIMQNYLMFEVSGGVTIDEGGKTGRMTLAEFCANYGIDRTTLWRRKQNIPNWDEMKREVRKQTWADRRVTKVWNGIFLRAAKGDYQQAALFLKNFSSEPVILPNEKLEIETGENLTRLLELAERRAKERNIIDATETTETNT